MKTRLKVRCISEKSATDDGYEYKFEPVTSGSEENEEFFNYTPYGELMFGVTAKRKFKAGKEYYVDITPVE